MSLLVDEVGAYLHAHGQGTVATDIFLLHRPATPVECVSIHATGGYPSDGYTQREHPTIMLFARSATPNGALRKAYTLYGLLHGKTNLTLGSLHALTIDAVAPPAYLGEESSGSSPAYLASLNVVVDLRTPSS